MALYRVGQASMDAQGVVKGYKTKWMSPLSLIRKEATIMFLTAQGVKLAVINEIISDTEIRAIATGGAVVDRTDYVILIHDSLTVDGMAQDVAETLRYYRGKETEFAHLIEVIEDMDMEKLKEVIEQMRAEVIKFEENFKKIEAKAQEVQTNANKVADDLALVEALHVRTDELAEQAKANADRAFQNFELTKGEVKKAQDEVATAQRFAGNAAEEVKKAEQVVATAKQEVVIAANAEAERAKAQADRAKNEADRAKELADQFDASKVMLKDKNLSDLTDKAAGRKNLGVERLVQDANMTRIKAQDGKTEMRIGFDDWYVYRDSQDSEAGYVALGVKGGGTGGTNVTEAKVNLEVDRLKQLPAQTNINYPTKNAAFVLRDSDLSWGVYDNVSAGWRPLGVAMGGTGSGDPAQARKNIGAAASGVNTDITETQKLKNIWAASRVEFLRDDLEADIHSLKRGGDINDEKFLRSFRCSGGAQIWHETVKNVEYKLSVGMSNDVEVFKIHSSNGVYFKGVKLLNTGDFGVGAVNPEKIADTVGISNGFYSALTNDNQLGTAWSIAGQAVGVLNFSMHPTRGSDFTSQIATSYSTNGRVFYRCTIDGTWRAWKEFALNGATGFNFGSGLNVSNTQGAQTYVSFDVINRGRPATDNGSKVSIEIPYTTERPYMLQRRNDGSTSGQIVNKLPTLFGEFMVRNAYKLNLGNGNFNNYVNTQFTTFMNGGTTHGAQNTPNVAYGNMMVIGTGNIGTVGDYATQVVFDKSTAIPYLRCMNDNSAGTWTAWQKVTVAAVSDANLKNIRGNMNVEGALDNINRMEFKIFSFKDDATQRYRRGVISQQIRKIDKDYVNMVGDRMVLDQTPMMLDGLAAIKALRARDEANKERISKLEKEVEELKSLVAALIHKPTPLDV